MTGWVTTIAWHASTIGKNYLNASLIQALAELNYPNYVPQKWHAILIFYAIVALSVAVTTLGAKVFPKFEAVTLILHIVGFFFILVTLIYLAPKNSLSDVFQVFINGGGFTSNAQSWLVGSVSVMFTFIGIDAAVHMAEEIKDAAVVIPRAMISSVILNDVLGLGMLVAILFCMGPIEDVLSSEFSFPFINILASVTNSTGGATAMVMKLVTQDESSIN
ncbi:MAG: hypothetical protein MMC33_000682 [Icmadophila ericetorum]|nr:hypothetical protein [Icmadophila ericetorum]